MNAIFNPSRTIGRTAMLWLILLCGLWAQAQPSGPVATGVVRNSKGEVLGNVAVVMNNQNHETVASGMTNDKGIFSFPNLPVGGPYHFIFSHIGFVSDTLTGYNVQEKGRISVSVTLRLKSEELNVVVVTALGIRREEKSIGYAAQTIKENAVSDAKTNNWVNALSGKVAGLNIQGAGAGPMGSSRITLRGESS
ncbi:MAG TPA: carboxypeptidase-like regulatory domain-containing protein, partial [Pseudobacter sp.]|nr:carboxypeptidase-like regulatory domain-containing protein [Pseudobacter sp.]